VLAALAKRMACSEDVAALRLIIKYRKGELGKFTLDEITPESALAIASSTTGMTLLQANQEHARLVKKRKKVEERRTALATHIISAQREAAKEIAAQQHKVEARIAAEERKRIGASKSEDNKVLQIEGATAENGQIVLTDEMRRERRARTSATIDIRAKRAGEAAREKRSVIELAKALLRPLPELPPEPKPRRKNKKNKKVNLVLLII